MMEPLKYLHLQMQLEGMGLIQSHVITGLHADGDTLPLVLVAQTAKGQTVTYLSEALPVALREELVARSKEIMFPNVEVLLHSLRSSHIHPQTGHFKTYVFPEHYAEAEVAIASCFPKDEPKIQAFGFDSFAEQVYAIECEGSILAACVSVRQNAQCAEAWVYTAPEHRGKGLAQRVVTAWAKGRIAEGIIPLYSHKIENRASAKLAYRLGLTPVFEEIGIEKSS